MRITHSTLKLLNAGNHALSLQQGRAQVRANVAQATARLPFLADLPLWRVFFCVWPNQHDKPTISIVASCCGKHTLSALSSAPTESRDLVYNLTAESKGKPSEMCCVLKLFNQETCISDHFLLRLQ